MSSEDVLITHRSPTRRKGFAQIPHAVLIDQTLTDGAKVLYGILLSYAMQAESFRCSQPKMAADCGKDDRTVRRMLKMLHRRGLITPVQYGKREVNGYILEDAYALYDLEQPKPTKRRRNTIGPDSGVRSHDRASESGRAGLQSPVVQDSRVRLLNTLSTNKEENKAAAPPGDSSLSLFQEKDKPFARSRSDEILRTADTPCAKAWRKNKGLQKPGEAE